MNEAQLARLLIEDLPQKTGKLDKKVGVLGTRMLLQIQSVPSLLAHLVDFSVGDPGPEGKVKIQFDFLKLPKEIIPELEKLLSVDYFKGYRLLKYVKNGQARTGLEVEVSPQDLPGSAYDYSN